MISFRQQRGFTLLEVLISVAIVGIGLIALVTLFPVGLRSSRLAGDFTTASFISQQALDNIRAAAQVYDPADMIDENGDGDRFDDSNGDGFGYYDLPVSAVKGYFSSIRLPNEPTQSQWWKVRITADAPPATFSVTNSIFGNVGNGNVDAVFTSTDNAIAFVLFDNEAGSELGAVFNEGTAPFDNTDIDYPDFEVGDEITIHLEIHGGIPYYWYAMRSPVTEDRDLDGILDGRLPNGESRTAPHNQVQEDTGIDLVPDFYDTDMRDAGVGTAGYQQGLDKDGEFGTVVYPADPHGDNYYAYESTNNWWDTATVMNENGTEGNGVIDAWSDDYMQKVTVTVGWREGGQDRSATFSAAVANQFR